MKKLIASLALAGLASLAFAQTPSFVLSGNINTGLTAISNFVDAAQIGYWGEDSGVLGGRVKLVGTLTNGTVGGKFDLRFDRFNSASPALFDPYFKTAYVYANFFDKMVYTQAGILDERTVGTGGDAGISYSKETPGFLFMVKPITGLAVDAVVAPASLTGTSAVGDTAVSVGAAYTLDKVAKVVAQAKFSNTAPAGTYNYAVSAAYAGAGLLIDPNLTAWVEAQATNLNKLNSQSTGGNQAGKLAVTETVKYGFKDLGLPALTAGLIAYEYFYGADVKNNTASGNTNGYAMGLKLTPWVTYTVVPGITPKLAFTYQSGPDTVGGPFDSAKGVGDVAYNGSTAKQGGGSTGYSGDLTYAYPKLTKTAAKTDFNKIALIDIKPSVKFDLTAAQSISLTYSYIASVGTEDLTFLSANLFAKSLHTFQLDYLFNF